MKKKSVEDTENTENMDYDSEEESSLGTLNFNVEDEYKPNPLIPKGLYHGVVNVVKFIPSQVCISWDVCLHDNGGYMNDNETIIDGAHVYFKNWLPRPGDEDVLTKSGKTNKRQSKINILRNFSTKLNVDMSTPAIIATAIEENLWVGTEVDVEISISEYEGKFNNSVNRMLPSKMY